MAKLVKIMAVVEDDWSMQDFMHAANDALCKHDVVMYVKDVEVIDENYALPVGEG